MCCLFGIIDHRHSLTARQKNRLLSALATAAEDRGTDATGIAYNSDGKLRVYKRPWPAHCMRFRVPEDASVIMGHTRMTTQGAASRNRNNHPFTGYAGGQSFALAHNGVLYNDGMLRRALGLPQTAIETDSFIGVQLIEQEKALDFASLQYMAEQVEGSFVFTVLDRKDGLYFVKGDNPLCLYQFPKTGLFVYASTEEILKQGLSNARLPLGKPAAVPLHIGDILYIGPDGRMDRQAFDASGLLPPWRLPGYRYFGYAHSGSGDDDYLNQIKSVAVAFGYTPEAIDRLAAHGFTPEELEELLYEGGSGCEYL